MRSPSLTLSTAAGVGVAVVALSLAAGTAASASGRQPAPATASGPTESHTRAGGGGCPAQRDNDTGVAIVSQNFSDQPGYDSQAADDFKAPCKVATVTADGVYFNGSGPADSFDVDFYRGNRKPNRLLHQCHHASYTDSGFGTPTVTCKVTFTGSVRRWVSVVANLSFSAGGEWGWGTNKTVRGRPAQWQNPGNGFGTGCTTWARATQCFPGGEPFDLSFSLNR